MEWRIRKSSNGGFVAEYGAQHDGGILAPSGIGVTMPAFIVYKMSKHETLSQAKRHIKLVGGNLDNVRYCL